jgi:hypothetical protein
MRMKCHIVEKKIVITKLVLIFSFLTGCSYVEMKPEYNLIPDNRCCAERNRDGSCTHELIPGCSDPNNHLFSQEYLVEDNCCAHWSANGMCYVEIEKGCSKRLFKK